MPCWKLTYVNIPSNILTKLTLLSQYKTRFQYSWQINHPQFCKPADSHNHQPFSFPLPTNFAFWSHFLYSVSAISGEIVYLWMLWMCMKTHIGSANHGRFTPDKHPGPEMSISACLPIYPSSGLYHHMSRLDHLSTLQSTCHCWHHRWSVASRSTLCNYEDVPVIKGS